MNELVSFGTVGIWLTIFSSILLAFCLYFFLTYFEHLKQGDDRLIKQSKLFAVLSLLAALLIPAIYQLIVFIQMMRY